MSILLREMTTDRTRGRHNLPKEHEKEMKAAVTARFIRQNGVQRWFPGRARFPRQLTLYGGLQGGARSQGRDRSHLLPDERPRHEKTARKYGTDHREQFRSRCPAQSHAPAIPIRAP